MKNLDYVLYVLAFACFAVATFLPSNPPERINFTAAGLALLTVSLIL